MRCYSKMNTRTIYFLSFIVCVLSEIPDYLKDKRCPMNKDLEACFIKNGNLAIPLVARGDPNYQIPKLNPMEIPFIQLISTPTLGLNLTNVKIYGLSELVIDNVKLNWAQNIFTIKLKNSNITIQGDYTVDGRVLIMPIKGNGQFNVLLKNGLYEATSLATTFEKNGDKFFKPIETRLNYRFDNVKFQFDNLFDGNKELGDQVNKFLNENWDLLLIDFGPGIAATISSIIEDIFEKFASKISLENFFLDDNN